MGDLRLIIEYYFSSIWGDKVVSVDGRPKYERLPTLFVPLKSKIIKLWTSARVPPI